MNIPANIEKIVKERQQKLPLIKEIKEHIESVKQVIDEIDSICSSDMTYSHILEQQPEIEIKIKTIDTKLFKVKYEQAYKLIDSLMERCSRKYIHISFVGSAGQGKSLVMQRISGLSPDIIPSSDGSDCTGAKSIITNNPSDEVKAEIIFYTKDEYCEIVNNYLNKIFENSFKIYSVNEICSLSIEKLKSKFDSRDILKNTLFKHLVKYINHSSDIIPLLGTKKTVCANEIEHYVAQYSHKNKDIHYYFYLGVKVANILCKFPCQQSGKIVLVDTIGLGATSLNVQQQMLETVSKDSDAIMLMKRPDSNRARLEQDDIEIVRAIQEKVTPEYAEKLLFWIINKVNSGAGKNVDGVPIVMAEIKDMKDVLLADYLVVDCNDRNEVENKLLIPVLNKLIDNLPEMDNFLLENCKEALNNLYYEYHTIAKKMNQACFAEVDKDIKREFQSKNQIIIEKMTNKIRDMYLENGIYGRLRNIPCDNLKLAATKKLKNIIINIPSEDEILTCLQNGTIHQHNAYEYFTNKMRLKIIDDFLELNNTLNDMVSDMKREIVKCLSDENIGKLGYIIPYKDDANSWLIDFSNYLSEKDNYYKPIKNAIDKLIDFELKMEGFVIYRIRAHLDPIDISLKESGPKLQAGMGNKQALKDDILFWLKYNLEVVYKEIRTELESLYTYPNNALWAVVRDFHDRIVYSENVSIAWRYLYEDTISYIWNEDLKKYQQRINIDKFWNDFIEKIKKYDCEKYFLI